MTAIRGARRRIPLPLVGGVLAVAILLGAVVIARSRSHAAPVHLSGKVVNHGTASVAAGGTLLVRLESTAFSPTFIEAPAGAHVIVHLQNEGFHAHTFTVADLGINVVLAPGQATDVPVTLPSSGTTLFECTFHRSLGMRGAFVVRS